MGRVRDEVYVHLVWATWDREPWLDAEVQRPVYRCINTECDELGVEVLALGGTIDHVHLLVKLPTTVAIATLVKQAKGSSSHLVNHAVYSDGRFKWQGHYAVFSVSRGDVTTVQRYIVNQEQHHSNRTTDDSHELPAEPP